MTRLKRSMLVCILVPALIILLLPMRAAQAISLNCGEWGLVPSANPGLSSVLDGVTAIAANNIWAGGTYQPRSGGTFDTLIENWNGTSWSVVTSPNVGSNSNILDGMAAVTASDIWAVGSQTSKPGKSQTLIEHWDGTSWKVVTSPNPGTLYDDLNGVAAISANNVWAVGYASNPTGVTSTLVEHWNGSKWSVVSTANPGTYQNVLQGVKAISATNIWAVGFFANSSNGSLYLTLIEHWNGTSWSVVPSPSPGTNVNVLDGVAALSANNIWAAGDDANSGGPAQTLIEHWNGTSWSVVPSPNAGTGTEDNTLYGIAAVSANNIWVVGSYVNYATNGAYTLIEQWNGSTWSIVSSPSIGGYGVSNYLTGVAQVPSNSNIWAVGYYSTSGGAGPSRTLTELYC